MTHSQTCGVAADFTAATGVGRRHGGCVSASSMPTSSDPACAACAGCTTCSMDCLQQGCLARVLSVSGDREFRRRLLEMGFCNGVCVEMIRRAPFGDPIEFRLRGYNLSLRHEQARQVLVSLAG